MARVGDRFGDHGLVGVALLRVQPDAWEIDTFLLSCRVIGRSVETALLSAITADAERSGARAVEGSYIPTRKTAPASSFFKDHGFTCLSEEADFECVAPRPGASGGPGAGLDHTPGGLDDDGPTDPRDGPQLAADAFGVPASSVRRPHVAHPTRSRSGTRSSTSTS